MHINRPRNITAEWLVYEHDCRKVLIELSLWDNRLRNLTAAQSAYTVHCRAIELETGFSEQCSCSIEYILAAQAEQCIWQLLNSGLVAHNLWGYNPSATVNAWACVWSTRVLPNDAVLWRKVVYDYRSMHKKTTRSKVNHTCENHHVWSLPICTCDHELCWTYPFISFGMSSSVNH